MRVMLICARLDHAIEGMVESGEGVNFMDSRTTSLTESVEVGLQAEHRSERIRSSLRRLFVTLGGLFVLAGLGLLLAGTANAATGSGNGGADPSGLLGPVSAAVSSVAAPVTDPVSAVVARVATPVTEAAKPVADTVARVTAPATETVMSVTAPVLRTVAAVTAPVTETVTAVTEPVTKTVTAVTAPVTAVVTEPVAEQVGEVAAPVPAVRSTPRSDAVVAGPTGRQPVRLGQVGRAQSVPSFAHVRTGAAGHSHYSVAATLVGPARAPSAPWWPVGQAFGGAVGTASAGSTGTAGGGNAVPAYQMIPADAGARWVLPGGTSLVTQRWSPYDHNHPS